MAKLIRERARKPIMDGAAVYADEDWTGGEQFFCINLFDRDQPRHAVKLSRSEMLEVVSVWLKSEAEAARRSAQKEREANKAA